MRTRGYMRCGFAGPAGRPTGRGAGHHRRRYRGRSGFEGRTGGALRAPGLDERGRDQRDRLDSAVDRIGQAHRDTVTGGQCGDHEQTEAGIAGECRDPEVRRFGQQTVALGRLLLGHPQALIRDLDRHTLADDRRRDLDLGFRRRERGGVVHQLREQMDQVGHGLARDEDIGYASGVDPGVVQALRDRAADEFPQRNRVAPPAARLFTTEHDQVLRVAPGAGGEMVELEEQFELVGVLLLALGLVQQGELAVYGELVAVGDIEEDRMETGACLRLGHRGRDGGHLGPVERVGHFTEFVGTEVQPRDFGGRIDLLALIQPVHDVGQPLVGELQGVVTQAAHPGDEAVGQHERGEEGQPGEQQHRGAAGQRSVGGIGALGATDGMGVGALALPELQQGGNHLAGCPLPVGDGQRQGGCIGVRGFVGGAVAGTGTGPVALARGATGLRILGGDRAAQHDGVLHGGQLVPGRRGGESLQLGQAGPRQHRGGIGDLATEFADLPVEFEQLYMGELAEGQRDGAQGVGLRQCLSGP